MHRTLPLLFAAMLTACAAASDYPSLERRPIERMSGSGQAVTPEAPPPPPAPASPELTTRLGQLVEQARSAHTRFVAKRAAAERLVGTGRSAPGSESWSVATAALSDLEAARSDAMIALAELDQMFAGESISASETGNRASLDAVAAARDQVTALVGAEDQVLAGLRGRMPG